MKHKRIRDKICLIDVGAHGSCHIISLFIALELHMFFNTVNTGTALNVTDGFKGDLAD